MGARPERVEARKLGALEDARALPAEPEARRAALPLLREGRGVSD